VEQDQQPATVPPRDLAQATDRAAAIDLAQAIDQAAASDRAPATARATASDLARATDRATAIDRDQVTDRGQDQEIDQVLATHPALADLVLGLVSGIALGTFQQTQATG
jgi:hypothetical protein